MSADAGFTSPWPDVSDGDAWNRLVLATSPAPYSMSGPELSPARWAASSWLGKGLFRATYTPYSTPSSTSTRAADLSVFTFVLLDEHVQRAAAPPVRSGPARSRGLVPPAIIG